MQIILDAMNNPAGWTATLPDDLTPSTQFNLASDQTKFRYSDDRSSLKLQATNNAFRHKLRRAIPATDLTGFDECRLWIRSDQVADGSSAQPFLLQFKLGGNAMTLDNPANTWFRYLPVFQPGVWEMVRIGIDDLAPAVRSAVSAIELRYVGRSSAECNLEMLLAVRGQMLGDVESGLLALLHQRVSVNGAPVAAAVYNPDDPQAQPKPRIQLILRSIQWAGERAQTAQVRGDFTDRGFRLWPPSAPYYLFYDVDVAAERQSDKTAIWEFVLRTLMPRRELVVNGAPLPLEWINAAAVPEVSLLPGDRPLLRFRVATAQRVGAPEPAVPPFREVKIDVDAAAPSR